MVSSSSAHDPTDAQPSQIPAETYAGQTPDNDTSNFVNPEPYPDLDDGVAVTKETTEIDAANSTNPNTTSHLLGDIEVAEETQESVSANSMNSESPSHLFDGVQMTENRTDIEESGHSFNPNPLFDLLGEVDVAEKTLEFVPETPINSDSSSYLVDGVEIAEIDGSTSSINRKSLSDLVDGVPIAEETLEQESANDLNLRSSDFVDGPVVAELDGAGQESQDLREAVFAGGGFELTPSGNVCETDGDFFDNSERFHAPKDEETKRVLPTELSKGVVRLECDSLAPNGSCDVYLVGTAHVSQESCREVQAIIRLLKPQVVFLELCSSRVSILKTQNLQVPTMNEMMDMWRKKHMNVFGILYSWFLAKVADKLEVLPGSEFRVAFEEAMSYGAKVILGDRPVQITLRRTWGKMSLWHKAKFLCYIFFQAIFLPSPEELNKMLKEMDDADMLTLVIKEMSKTFPTLMETLVYERDLYMSSTLLNVASAHASVVAVVGRGHISGIQKHWKQPIEVRSLLELPERKPRRSCMKILTSFGVAAVGIAIISGIYFAEKR